MFEVNVRRLLLLVSSSAKPLTALRCPQTFTPAQFGALYGFLVAYRGDLSCAIIFLQFLAGRISVATLTVFTSPVS